VNWNTHPVPLIWPNDLWLFPETKSALQGQKFQDIEDIQNKCDDSTGSHSITGVPKMFAAVAESLG
jgi:hypothetical protein